jgi:hypothetical protein
MSSDTNELDQARISRRQRSREHHGRRGVKADDRAAMEARMDAIRLKQILGEPLSDHELMCLQIEQNGFACQGCSSPRIASKRTESSSS